MSVSPFNRVRPATTTSLQEPSRIESSAGKSNIDELGIALADISVKSMADVAAGVRAASVRKGKGVGGKASPGPTAAPPPVQQPSVQQTQGSDNETMATKISKAVEQAVVTTPVTSQVAATGDAFETTSRAQAGLSSFSDDASSTPAAQSNASEAVKAFALAPVRLRG